MQDCSSVVTCDCCVAAADPNTSDVGEPIPISGALSSDDGEDVVDVEDAPSVMSVPLLLVLLLPGLPPIFCKVCSCSSLIVCSGEMFSLISSFISLGIVSQSWWCGSS